MSAEIYDKLRTITLPVTKKVITLRLPTGKDTKDVEKRLNQFRSSGMKVDQGTEYVYNLASCIDTIDGETKTLVERGNFL